MLHNRVTAEQISLFSAGGNEGGAPLCGLELAAVFTLLKRLFAGATIMLLQIGAATAIRKAVPRKIEQPRAWPAQIAPDEALHEFSALQKLRARLRAIFRAR